MKVVFLLKDFRAGGVENVFINYAKRLKELGATVYFCVLSNAIVEGEDQFFFSNQFYAQKLYELRNFLLKENVEKLITAKEKSNLFGFLCTLFTDVVVLFCRHAALNSKEQSVGSFVIRALYSLYSLKKNAKFSAVSSAIAKDISFLFNEHKFTVVPNPIFNNFLSDNSGTYAVLDNNNPFFLSAGRLVPLKGFDFLIKTYAKAKSIDPELPILLIAGDGPEKISLISLINALKMSDFVCVIGYPQNIIPLMKRSDAFIMTSRSEGMPTVLIEAIHARCRIISTDCVTGPRELLHNYNCGCLIDVDDEVKLLDLMLYYSKIKQPTIDAAKLITETYSVDNSLKVLGVFE